MAKRTWALIKIWRLNRDAEPVGGGGGEGYGRMMIEVSGTALIKKLAFRTENTVIRFMYESNNDSIGLAS